MELMTKYQYTYFIYPYVIDSKKYDKYIMKLLKNKMCKWRIFEKEKDMHLYHYFLPSIRKNMFWTFDLNKNAIKNFENLDISMQANLLSKHECNIFQYQLSKDLQGKIGEKDGIFFEINEIKIICYKTGICFLLFKTSLVEDKNFSNILNFNYKFREINSKTYTLKEYENIKIQSDMFKDTQEISAVIKEIAGANTYAKKINLDDEQFLVYSYTCLDQNTWNDQLESGTLRNEFVKYRQILPANKQITDNIFEEKNKELYENKYIHYGFSSIGTVLLTSDISTANYTTVAQKYESEYLYTYILHLYKRYLLKKLNHRFNQMGNFKLVEKEFLAFAKDLWIQEITNDDFGKELIKKWDELFNIEELFMKLKTKYDILYKKYHVGSSNKTGKWIIAIISIMIILNIVNLIILFFK